MNKSASIPFWAGPVVGPLLGALFGWKAAVEAHEGSVIAYVSGGAALGLVGGLVVAALDFIPRMRR